MKIKLSQRAYLTVIIPLALQICFLAALGGVLDISERQAADDYRDKEVIGHSNWLEACNFAGNLLACAYVVDNDPFYLQNFKKFNRDALIECHQLASLYTPEDEASGSVQALRTRTSELFAMLNSAVEKKSIDLLRPQTLKPIWLQLTSARFQMLSSDRKRYHVTAYTIPQMRSYMHTAIMVLAAIDLAAGVIALLWFNRHIVTRLTILMDNAWRFASGDPLNAAFGGNDELGELDATFHVMARQVKAAQDALTESEERMRLLLENVPSALLGIDRDYIVQTANPAAASLFQCHRDQLAQAHLEKLLNLPHADFSETIAQAGNKPVELFINLNKGDRRPVEMSISEYKHNSKELMLVTMTDLSDRHEAERLKQEFVGMIGHDLKSPLTVIENLCELLSSKALGELNDYGHRMVGLASTQLKRLSRLVNDLTDVAQLESNTFSLEKKNARWSALLQQARAAVLQQAEERSISIVSSPADLWLEVDPIRIVQVLVNLLGNALKFSPTGSQITVEALDEGETVLVTVADQGRGIPPADLERIFERFQQVSASDAKLKGGLGLGLGLAICKAIVQQHDGTMGVTSEPGQGSTFWFRLPGDHEQG